MVAFFPDSNVNFSEEVYFFVGVEMTKVDGVDEGTCLDPFEWTGKKHLT